MPAAATKANSRRKRDSATLKFEPIEVLTLAEAASFLRVAEADVVAMVREGLPGRKIAGQWRFLKSALCDWLRVPRQDFWETQLGAFSDDASLESLLQEIYERRGQRKFEDA
jgi:Helix-turn-helix domain